MPTPSPKKYEKYGQNRPLKKPHRTAARSIFRSVNMIFTQGCDFLPTWDITDHLNFACGECHAIADVLSVEFVPNMPPEGSTLFFFLGCPECGKTGMRKIYLELGEAPFQRTLSNKNELLMYVRKKRTPAVTQPLKK